MIEHTDRVNVIEPAPLKRRSQQVALDDGHPVQACRQLAGRHDSQAEVDANQQRRVQFGRGLVLWGLTPRSPSKPLREAPSDPQGTRRRFA